MNNCVLALEQIYQIQNLAKQEQIYSTSMQTKIKNKMGLKTATIMKICQKLYTCPKKHSHGDTFTSTLYTRCPKQTAKSESRSAVDGVSWEYFNAVPVVKVNIRLMCKFYQQNKMVSAHHAMLNKNNNNNLIKNT